MSASLPRVSAAERRAISFGGPVGAGAAVGVDGAMPLFFGAPGHHRLDLAGCKTAKVTQQVGIVWVEAIDVDLAVTDAFSRGRHWHAQSQRPLRRRSRWRANMKVNHPACVHLRHTDDACSARSAHSIASSYRPEIK